MIEHSTEPIVIKTAAGSWERVTDPPLLIGKDVRCYLDKPYRSSYPCHSQSVERAVQLTTQSVASVIDPTKQLADGLITDANRLSDPGKVTRKGHHAK